MSAEPGVSAAEIASGALTAVGLIGAAIIAAVVVVWEWHQKNALDRKRARELYATRQRNLLAAIRADLTSEYYSMNAIFGSEEKEKEKHRYREYLRKKKNAQMPQSSSAPTLFKVEDLQSIFELIPVGLMEKITSVYKLNAGLNIMLDEMRRGVYDRLAVERQEKLLTELFQLGETLLAKAKDAVEEIDLHLNPEAASVKHPYSGATPRDPPVVLVDCATCKGIKAEPL